MFFLTATIWVQISSLPVKTLEQPFSLLFLPLPVLFFTQQPMFFFKYKPEHVTTSFIPILLGVKSKFRALTASRNYVSPLNRLFSSCRDIQEGRAHVCHIYCYLPRVKHSTWHIVGTQLIFVSRRKEKKEQIEKTSCPWKYLASGYQIELREEEIRITDIRVESGILVF